MENLIKRETYLDRTQHLEKELDSVKSLKALEPSTSPKEPETWRRDDAATSREGELRESGVSGREEISKKDGTESVDSKGKKANKKDGVESVDSEGDPSELESMSSEHASVVGKSGER